MNLMPDRLRVLVAAYACSPVRGSEAGVGWGWVKALARYHDLWVLTAEHYRDEIESGLARESGLDRHVNFHYVPRYRAMFLERFWEPAYLWTYKHQWQRQAYRVARQLHAEIGFDVVHQLTYVGFRVPGYLWKLGIPLVWGPLGGLEQLPWRLFSALEWRGRAYYLCRNLWNEFDRRFAPSPRRVLNKSAAIIAATSGIRCDIRRFYRRDSSVVCEIGAPPGPASRPRARSAEEPLHLLWSGNHNPGKALPILLRALACLPPRVDWRLTILGAGPRTSSWRRLSAKLGVEFRCRWLGQVPRARALAEMQSAHVFVITSLYDLTSTVLVEALANGLPVICPDLYGFHDAVTRRCGFRIPASSPAHLVAGIARSIELLHGNEELRYRMALAALGRSQDFSWESKAEVVDGIYRTVANQVAVPELA
jgi:glycosyltransferase involved in cell wall biosynthesis